MGGLAKASIALLFAIWLGMPQALANPNLTSLATPAGHLLGSRAGDIGAQVTPSSSSQGTCFGYNHVNDSFIPRMIEGLRIAVVQPILTSTPYSQYETGSFYAFYSKEQGVTTNVTTSLDLLSTNIASGYAFNQGWGLSIGMFRFLNSQTAVDCGLELGKNVRVLTDIDVSQGALFDAQNQTPRFDVVILPFSEYVTAQEYLAYENFVATGGTLVMMGHSLEYPVTYNATTNLETLVYGHGWAFNGRYAYPIACSSNTYVAECPWARNNTDWTGSNTCMSSCFHTYKFNGSMVNPGDPIGRALSDEFGSVVFKSYVSHEENSVTNMTGTSVVSVFVNDSTNLIAAYTHQFRKGSVVCMGVFGDDIIATDQSAQYFVLRGIVSGRTIPASNLTSSTTTSSSTAVSSSTVSNGSTQERAPTSTAAAPRPLGAFPTWLVVGALAAAAVVVGVVFLRRRQAIQRT